jgi:hypothetical protein
MRKSRLLLPTRRDVVPTDAEELDYYSHLPKAVKKAVWERDEGRCQWCGAEDTPENPIHNSHTARRSTRKISPVPPSRSSRPRSRRRHRRGPLLP